MEGGLRAASDRVPQVQRVGVARGDRANLGAKPGPLCAQTPRCADQPVGGARCGDRRSCACGRLGPPSGAPSWAPRGRTSRAGRRSPARRRPMRVAASPRPTPARIGARAGIRRARRPRSSGDPRRCRGVQASGERPLRLAHATYGRRPRTALSRAHAVHTKRFEAISSATPSTGRWSPISPRVSVTASTTLRFPPR